MNPALGRSAFLRQDLSAAVVVFLIALPLSLGISIASDAPLLSGVITGIVGGVVVSLFSGSELSVSGSAAGLAAVVVAGQQALGSFEAFVVATILAGAFQILLGMMRAGFIASLIPASVIRGMVVGIGIIIICQQVPHALGIKNTLHFEESVLCLFSEFCEEDSAQELQSSLNKPNEAATIIFFGSLILLAWWNRNAHAGRRFFLLLPPPLAAVLTGIAINQGLGLIDPDLLLSSGSGYLVQLPEFSGFSELMKSAPDLDLSFFRNEKVWQVAASLAVVASIQSLLSVEATDKLDPARRVSDPNRELIAQGVGNAVSGFLGGLPMTSVIVRSSANIYAGAHSRIACLGQGILLLLSVLFLAKLINLIPLASLGAILLVVGFQLVNLGAMQRIFSSGPEQWIPFIVTAVSVIAIDLFTGVLLGTVVGLLIVLKMNFHTAFTVIREGNDFFVRFAKDVTFLQKFVLRRTLAKIPDGATVYIDGGGAMFIDYDIRDVIDDFKQSATERDIEVSVRNLYAYKSPLLG
jgi:MFS superfamily sulfate permease-like transporter